MARDFERRRRTETVRVAITVLLLVVAAASIAVERATTMAGAIIGYVAAYWLPAPLGLTRRP